MSRKSWAQGTYTPKHPEKYIGDLSKLIYKSSWELTCFRFFDNNLNVIRWGYEPLAIPYLKPTDNRVHKYHPDFFVEYIDRNNEVIREVIEVKPKNQATMSTAKRHKTRLQENLTYAINVAKWTAAKRWCEERNIGFRVVVEDEIFRN